MPYGPKRFQQAESLHFITFSCFHRLPYLTTEAKPVIEAVLEQTRSRHQAEQLFQHATPGSGVTLRSCLGTIARPRLFSRPKNPT